MGAGSLPPINDISGEHGLSDRGGSHKRGVNIDMFHFGAPTNPGTAEAYYQTIKGHARTLTTNPSNPTALAALSAWATAQRSGLTSLVDAPGVRSVRLISGQGEGMLQAGWGRSLICSGTLPRTNGAPVQVVDPAPTGGCPTHTGVSVVYEAAHNNHFHVELPIDYNGAGIPAGKFLSLLQ